LSLDDGGSRGVFSLQTLASIEALFRQEQKRGDLVLADVFDLFAGTSTGAIIATCLSNSGNILRASLPSGL
jgi:patatin-like phospholipase/acyl hydrolase